MCRYQRRPENSFGSLGAAVVGNCELPEIVLGTDPGSSAPNHWAIPPAPGPSLPSFGVVLPQLLWVQGGVSECKIPSCQHHTATSPLSFCFGEGLAM